jgi:hypothetical protein
MQYQPDLLEVVQALEYLEYVGVWLDHDKSNKNSAN